MARTRAQTKTDSSSQSAQTVIAQDEGEQKRSVKRSKGDGGQKRSKKPKTMKDKVNGSTNHAKINLLISTYGKELPLQGLLEEPRSATAETMLALLLNAMLSSAGISHVIAAQTLEHVIKAGYHKLATLKNSSWKERTVVLTNGGYTHYREKTATSLGELAVFVDSKYDGDLNNVVTQAKSDPKKIAAALKQIKGLGEVGIGIFLDTAQHLWTCLAPTLDSRSIKTAEAVGLVSRVNRMWEAVGKDPEKMCRPCSRFDRGQTSKK